jgi:hypothetical protein
MADGLLGGVLPYIYSRADALKRTLGDIVSNPMASTEQVVNNVNDRSRYLNQLHSQIAQQGISGLTSPQGQELTNLYGQAYNPTGLFIGAKSKIWNSSSNEIAKTLEKQGLTPEQIWEKTGNWKAPDGQWRQEISDKLAEFRANFDASSPSKANDYISGLEGQVGGMYRNEDLYKAYPELLTSIRMKLAKVPEWFPNSASGGTYTKTYGGKSTVDINNKTEQGALDTAVHELQHAIQNLEGWQSGGTETLFKDMPNLSAFEQYRRLQGEAEARAAAVRRLLSPEERRAIFPEKSYDIPVNQLNTDPFGNTIGSSIR